MNKERLQKPHASHVSSAYDVIGAIVPHDVRRLSYQMTPRYKRDLAWRQANPPAFYSGRPFDVTRSIFVHIPKSAGVSICKNLYNGQYPGHKRIKSYELIFSKKDFYSYFKFTFVRNPWDRIYSAFNFLKKGGMNAKDAEFSTSKLNSVSFRDFVLEWLPTYGVFSYIHFYPQAYFIKSFSGKINLDFVGFYENLNRDYSFVLKRMGSEAELGHENIVNKDKKYRFIEAYDSEMMEAVQKIYSEDVYLLGYNFDNTSLPEQIKRREKQVSD